MRSWILLSLLKSTNSNSHSPSSSHCLLTHSYPSPSHPKRGQGTHPCGKSKALSTTSRFIKIYVERVSCFSICNWVLFFQGLWRIVLGFWWGLPWSYRLPLVRLLFLLCWSLLSKSMGDLSIFWYFHQFLSSKTLSSCQIV